LSARFELAAVLVAGRARQIAAMQAAAIAVTRVRGLVFILVTSSRDIRDGNPRAYVLSHNSSVAVRRDPIARTRAERRQDG
jgi:hypothetical protein